MTDQHEPDDEHHYPFFDHDEYEPLLTRDDVALIAVGVVIALGGLLLAFAAGTFTVRFIGIIIALIGLFIDALGCRVITLSGPRRG